MQQVVKYLFYYDDNSEIDLFPKCQKAIIQKRNSVTMLGIRIART